MSDIIIREGLLVETGQIIRGLKPAEKLAIITEQTVAAHYLTPLRQSLTEAGFTVCEFVFPPGEASKNAATYVAALEFLASQQLTRSDIVIALGGGVVGDLAGFAAASYLRGLRLVQMPTTLLACVDSAIGGKTGIDLEAGKNLAGAFYPAEAVLIDPALLDSLPEAVFQDGMAEVIKYSFIDHSRLPALLDQQPLPLDSLIRACVDIKQGIVARDPFDRGERQLLNLGHTFGHAIERLSDYRLSHGRCVAIGLAIMMRACLRRGLCAAHSYDRLLALLQRYDLPYTTDYAADDIYALMLSDKKRAQGGITLVTLDQQGQARLYPTTLAEAKALLHEGLKP